jgi:hypothetical protein
MHRVATWMALHLRRMWHHHFRTILISAAFFTATFSENLFCFFSLQLMHLLDEFNAVGTMRASLSGLMTYLLLNGEQNNDISKN